jgi:hypothetical protein
MTPKLLCAAGLSLLLTAGCTKIGQIPPTIPLTAIQNLEEHPFKGQLDGLFLQNGNVPVIQDEHVPGQAIVAYTFRSSVAGAVTSLGVLLPAAGYEHTVTLWDSEGGQILAQAEVPTLDPGHWTYVNLAIVNQEVIIQPDHDYIVGFNTLAVGNAINSESLGNWVYLMNGINIGGPVGQVALFPFTNGVITFENYYTVFYDEPNVRLPFPGSSESDPYGPFSAPGVCDIGFIPAP